LLNLIVGKRNAVHLFFSINQKLSLFFQRYAVFFEYYLTTTSAIQEQLIVSVRSANRSKKLDTKLLISWLHEFMPGLADFSGDQDCPKSSEYLGRILAEFVHTGTVPMSEFVKYSTSLIKEESSEERNKFMVGLVKSLLKLDENHPKIFENSDLVKKGFCMEPKKYGKQSKRSQIPSAEDMPVLNKILGEGYESRIKLAPPRTSIRRR